MIVQGYRISIREGCDEPLVDDASRTQTVAARAERLRDRGVFTFTAGERALIEARRGWSFKWSLALQIGVLRMSGRVLDAVRIVPPALLKHLGSSFGE